MFFVVAIGTNKFKILYRVITPVSVFVVNLKYFVFAISTSLTNCTFFS